MLVQSRIKHLSRKLSYNTTFLSQNSANVNPEIQTLVEKLQNIQTSVQIHPNKGLNLISWKKQRYRPTESQHRIRIQNRIALTKICNEPIRPRIKPIKRKHCDEGRCHSQQIPDSYKEHYNQIRYKQNNVQKRRDSLQSEQEFSRSEKTITDNYSFKFHQNVSKYPKIIQYIQEQIDSKQQQKIKSGRTVSYDRNSQVQSKITEIYSPTRIVRNNKKPKQKIIQFDDQQTNSKVKSILNKWKPSSKTQQKLDTSTKPQQKKRLSTFFKTSPELFRGRLQKHKSISPQKRSTCKSQLYI